MNPSSWRSNWLTFSASENVPLCARSHPKVACARASRAARRASSRLVDVNAACVLATSRSAPSRARNPETPHAKLAARTSPATQTTTSARRDSFVSSATRSRHQISNDTLRDTERVCHRVGGRFEIRYTTRPVTVKHHDRVRPPPGVHEIRMMVQGAHDTIGRVRLNPHRGHERVKRPGHRSGPINETLELHRVHAFAAKRSSEFAREPIGPRM